MRRRAKLPIEVRVEYDIEPPSATFDCPGVEEEAREPGEHEDFDVGDFEGAFSEAPVKLDSATKRRRSITTRSSSSPRRVNGTRAR